jgi:flagellar basal body-associated protein FliL
MADVKKVVIVLLVITLILSAVSVVFNLMIYSMKSSESKERVSPSPNSGNLGFIVESNNGQEVQSSNGR